MRGKSFAVLALCGAITTAACGGEGSGEAGAGASPDTVTDMVTGTTGAPGPGTAGTPGTPGAPAPDTMSGGTQP